MSQECPTSIQYPEEKVLSYLKQVSSWMLPKLAFVIAFFDNAAFYLEEKNKGVLLSEEYRFQ